MTTTAKITRFDHSACKHAHSGAEGKKARAACRKEHALLEAKKTVRKPSVKATTRKPAARKPRATVAPKVLDMSNAEAPKVEAAADTTVDA